LQSTLEARFDPNANAMVITAAKAMLILTQFGGTFIGF
jgi:hypothetical protein